MSLTELDNIDASASFGRPSKYKPEYAEQAEKLCEFGATDYQLAEFFKVEQRTIDNWRIEHKDFFRSTTRAKEAWDDAVERSLLHRALGYNRKATKVMQYEGEIITAEYVEHVPASDQAIRLWLMNRRPTKWRDVSERKVEYTVTHKLADKVNRILERRALDAVSVQTIEYKPAITD